MPPELSTPESGRGPRPGDAAGGSSPTRPWRRLSPDLFRFATTELYELHVAIMCVFEETAVLQPALLDGMLQSVAARSPSLKDAMVEARAGRYAPAALEALTVGDQKQTTMGDRVGIVGSGTKAEPAFAPGTISGYLDDDRMEIGAQAAPTITGGALLNAQGEVVGIITDSPGNRAIAVPAPITLTGRSVAAPAIRSLSGSNTLSAGISVNVGSFVVNLQHFRGIGIVIDGHSGITNNSDAADFTRMQPAYVDMR